MLGVSGFETSSQFVESQKPGVFVKTLRNMYDTTTRPQAIGWVVSCCLACAQC